MEECAEIQKDAAKCLRFGTSSALSEFDPTNIENVVYELNDLLGVVHVLSEEFPEVFGSFGNAKAINDKKVKIAHYLKFSTQIGRLNE